MTDKKKLELGAEVKKQIENFEYLINKIQCEGTIYDEDNLAYVDTCEIIIRCNQIILHATQLKTKMSLHCPDSFNPEGIVEPVDLDIGEVRLDIEKTLNQLHEKIELLKTEYVPDDGMSFPIPSDITFENTIKLMTHLVKEISSDGYMWIDPFIHSDEDGWICIEWYYSGKSFHFDIDGNKITYTKLWKDNNLQSKTDKIDVINCLEPWKWFIDEKGFIGNESDDDDYYDPNREHPREMIRQTHDVERYR